MLDSTITIITDFGKGVTQYKRQRNDCTVCAVSKAFSVSYAEAHNSLKSCGRGTGKKFRFSYWLVSSSMPKGRYKTLDLSYNTTILNFCKEYHTGTYIVKTERPNHVFAVVNGVIYDKRPNRMRHRVFCAWQILPKI